MRMKSLFAGFGVIVLLFILALSACEPKEKEPIPTPGIVNVPVVAPPDSSIRDAIRRSLTANVGEVIQPDIKLTFYFKIASGYGIDSLVTQAKQIEKGTEYRQHRLSASVTSDTFMFPRPIPGDTTTISYCVAARNSQFNLQSAFSCKTLGFRQPNTGVVNPVDSVRISSPPRVASDTTKLAINWKIWPFPTGQTWTLHWIYNGVVKATSIQAQVTSRGEGTANVIRPTTDTTNISVCAQKSGSTIAEVCSPPVTFIQTKTVAMTGFIALGVGPPSNDYTWDATKKLWVPGTDSLAMPVVANFVRSADTGQQILMTSDSGRTWQKIKLDTLQTVKLARPAPGTSRYYGLCGYTYYPATKNYRALCVKPDTLGNGYYKYTQPTSALPMPAPNPDGTKQIVRLILVPARSVVLVNGGTLQFRADSQ